MNVKTLLLVPAVIALGAPAVARAYFGFGLNLAVPLYYPATVRPTAVVYQTPPEAPTEQVTASPGPGYVWMAGHWSFYGQKWTWVAGHWELPPSPSALWVPGHWAQGSSGWVWVDGTWTVGGPPSAPGTVPTPPAPPGATPPQQPPPPAGPPAPQAAPVPAPSSPPPPAPGIADGTVVDVEPPAPVAEYIPVCPYPGYVWIGGFWAWHGGWYWTAGHYARPPFRGAAWVSGGWSHGAHGWVWRGGHWGR